LTRERKGELPAVGWGKEKGEKGKSLRRGKKSPQVASEILGGKRPPRKSHLVKKGEDG